MYKINHFLFLKGSYKINWYEERRRNTRQKTQKKCKKIKIKHYINPFTFATRRSYLFSRIIQILILERYATLPMVKFRAGPPVIQLNKKLIMSAFREPLKYYDCYDSCH